MDNLHLAPPLEDPSHLRDIHMSSSSSSGPGGTPSKAGRASGLYLSGSLSSGPSAGATNRPPPRKRRRKTVEKSIWNSPDDWEELITTSALSTSSISSRLPRPRGLQTLVKCASDAAAKGFKVLWESGSPRGLSMESSSGRGWVDEWEITPGHLRGEVRNGVFRWWGGVLKLNMLKHFVVPPDIILPGSQLSCIADTGTVPRGLLFPLDQGGNFTILKLQHAQKLSDASIAALISDMPNLETLNLKGCLLANNKTARAILKYCKNVRRINMKGTSLDQEDLQALLDEYAPRLESLKVDLVQFFTSPDTTFASGPFPNLTHLCLPGDLINLSNRNIHYRAKMKGLLTSNPPVREAPSNALMDWHKFIDLFPSLTHLYLPGLLLPPQTDIVLRPHTLVKFHFGPGGPPVDVGVLSRLILAHSDSLRSIQLGHVTPSTPKSDFTPLATALMSCKHIEEFRWVADPSGSKDMRCDNAMRLYACETYLEAFPTWKDTLKLTLRIPQHVFDGSKMDVANDDRNLPLEHLDISGSSIDDSSLFAMQLGGYPNLRSLDLSGTNISDEDVFKILDHSPLISRIDLTSCRSVSVRHRRTIFAAWEASRHPPVEIEGRKRARRR